MTDADGFWKPSSGNTYITHDQVVVDAKSSSATPVFNFSSAPLAQQRMLLPIHKHKRQILYSVEKFGVVVIVGETACGKSTQIPHYLYQNGWCDNDFRIVCTQPRRIAAQTLASRVAKEVGRGELGSTVGYTVRFDDRSSLSTKIVYVTDGILLREATLRDPLLSRYSVVMVDEAHERNLNSDALLGLLKKIRRKRNDLRIVVCSATIDADRFLDFFVSKEDAVAKPRKRRRPRRWDNPNSTGHSEETETTTSQSNEHLNSGTIISVDGRQHSVDIMYLEAATSHYVRSTVETALGICKASKRGSGGGDILCFLPSGEDVDDAIRMAQDHVDDQEPSLAKQLVFLPLHSRLPYNMQARVFQNGGDDQRKGGTRRIIFSTNIAETSVTVPRITHVVDCGLVKLPYFDPKTDFERLIVVPTSQASAMQRAGRAGRLQAGQCYRLYTEDYFRKSMEESTPPEILRTNLSSFILTLKALGVENILGFDLMDLPGVDALSHGLESLYALGAIDDDTNLTQLGMDMSSFPTEPRVSRMLLESLREECSREVAGVASALQVRSLFLPVRGSSVRRQQLQLDYNSAISEFADSTGDHVTYANVIATQDEQRYDREDCKERFLDYVSLVRAVEVRDQLLRFLNKFGRTRSLDMASPEERSIAIRKCITAGFFFNAAKLRNDGRYYTIRGPNHILVTPSPSSIFSTHGSHAEYILFCETHDGSRGGIELSSVSVIDPRWLRELAPHYWV
jgi:ATP-dependent RNA helicase DDX35